MEPAPNTISPPNTLADSRLPNTKHSYGTRIRQNIILKPSIRLRHDPTPMHQPPRKHRQSSAPKQSTPPTIEHIPQNNNHNYPDFPPPHIVLHPDDASSKIFLAIARSFLSVDNRAMTIKDLSEMTVHFGYVCQNVSAASQAITSYIRAHLQRCETEQDCPLLLRHVLSGTPSDDDLLPALHSRSGGAHCAVNIENRVTNFRRGTTVWYLSRATGAPCPFARAGIRLCDYTEHGKTGPLPPPSKKEKRKLKERQRLEQQQQCGQKRKRSLRGCTARDSGSESDTDADKPPPKVKLTLRLKPLLAKAGSSSNSGGRRLISYARHDVSSDSSDSDSDSDMSVNSSDEESHKKDEEEPWSLPPYPRHSISIPCYTPCSEAPYPPFFTEASTSQLKDPFRRSPSIPYSIGSPPPESDEDEDFHVSMTAEDREWDADLDSEGDGETMWESPGPRSPSAPLIYPVAQVAVKEEPRDVQGMLDAWEDFDSSIADAKVAEVIAQAAATVLDAEVLGKVKVEALDTWDWDSNQRLSTSPEWGVSPMDEPMVKQEDLDIDSLFPASSSFADSSSPLSPISSLSSQFSAFSYADSPLAHRGSHRYDEDDVPSTARPSTASRPRAKTVPARSPFFKPTDSVASTSYSLPPTSHADSIASPLDLVASESNSLLPPPLSATQTLATLIQSMSVHSPTTSTPPSFSPQPPPACVSPQETRCKSSFSSAPSDVVVVHTCQPCAPTITATQIEDISVYQMMLGPSLLLRRIDTDFVNLSPIMAYCSVQQPILTTIPNATVITKGSPLVSGTWVPLAAAQTFVKENALPTSLLDAFLSDSLYERFPKALQDFHRSNAPARMLNQFGRHFASTLHATQVVGAEFQRGGGSWERNGTVMPISAPFVLSAALTVDKHQEEPEPPLNATEQEMFHELCVIPDWEKENSGSVHEAIQVDQPEPPKSPTNAPVEPSAPVNQRMQISIPAAASLDLFRPPSPLTPPPDEDVPALPVVAPQPPPERSGRPLRRSRRVADAAAAQSQSHTRGRGSRNSLS
ncbi:hypothetical protein BDQ12DRAFT_644791 [Crucibulum laeve]|uniref:GDS1 winged helix domain-containing protein n=1 Tax=Crucibulum laeve TaxID=68775 RepID=A0A5C3MDP8_9AGAR|nr:hypothetical protein BDQ12DRAFT_644791 [Crucibulum laeve]